MFARCRNGIWKEQALLGHLNEVSRIAGEFAERFGGKDWASLAGLSHDLGNRSLRLSQAILTLLARVQLMVLRVVFCGRLSLEIPIKCC
jgi:hypothetical protein